MKNPRHAANGAKPAHGPPHSEEHVVTSVHTAYQVPTYEPGADDTTVRGRHAAVDKRHIPNNGHAAEGGGVVIGGAANGAGTLEANGTTTLGGNGNGHVTEGTELATGNGHVTEGTELATGNGNGHQPNGHAAGSVQSAQVVEVEEVQEVERVADPDAPTPVGTDDEVIVPPLRGTTRIRYGAKEIGSGSGDLGRAGLERLRRHLPRRARAIALPRLALVLVLVLALVLAAAGVAVARVVQRLEGPANVAVATAGPAVIDSQPGGVGTIAAAPQDIATVALDVQGITAPVEVTSVDVIANQYVAAGTPLLQLNPLVFEQNLQQIQLSLHQAEETLASARAAAASPSAGSGNAYLAVQVPTSEGQVALDQQLLQIADGNTTSITAPIAGYVSVVRVAPGQVVVQGNTMIQIVNPTQVVVDAGMQLSDLPSVSVGDRATITPSQLPDVHLQGTVVAISAQASGDGLEGTVVVTAPNTPGQPVPIGSQSIVNISAPSHAAVSVPTLAVLNVEIAPVVGVVQNDRIHFQPVQIGASDGNRTQILSGLHAGEVVAVTNMQTLTNGDKVDPSSGGS